MDNVPAIEVHGTTHPGKKRQRNEDQFLCATLSKDLLVHQTSLDIEDESLVAGRAMGQLLVVADGIGGYDKGDLASRMAMESMTRHVLNMMPWFLGLRREDEDDLLDELTAAMKRSDALVARYAERSRSRNMGTTMTLAYLLWPTLYVVHAGDSRCYVARGEDLAQITRDHTVAQKMVDQGTIAADDAESSRWSHVLWNALGGGPEDVKPEVYKAELDAGDRVLLCSDGLTKHLDDDQILDLLRDHESTEECCNDLVAAAVEAGGTDNVTVVLASSARDATAE